tara:strand:- start:43463 stop:45022 length:1560 start_codon:yes stop_codon:yes gene_type:complete
MISPSEAMVTAIEGPVQRPAFQVLSYDISSNTGDTWGAIIDGSAVQTPVDLSEFISQVSWSYDRVSLTIADDTLRFHPDTGDLSVAICAGRGIRVIEGDTTVNSDQWIPIFSGLIQGSYEWSIKRGPVPQAKVTVFSRETNQAWNRRNVTSKEFTVGADWSNMFEDVAQNVMGLEDSELSVSRPWGLSFDKQSNQIVNIPAWEALVKLAQGNFNRIWFNGKGQLASFPFTLDRVDKVLTDNTLINTYSQPGSSTEVINKVSVTYIDNFLTKVSGTRQSLGTANLTAGFYDFETKLDVFYSDDKKQRADNVELVVKQSINQNDLGISIGTESLNIDDEFGGELVITVDFWVSALATAGIAGIFTSAAIPDDVVVVLVGGVTVPVGRLLEAASIVSVLLALMILGNGIYEIMGTPYDFAYLERKAIAMADNILFWEEKALDLRNEFISTEEHAHQLALNELLFQQSLGSPRTLVMPNDPRIEKGDILQLPTGAKFFVQSASKTLGRGNNVSMELTGFRSIV